MGKTVPKFKKSISKNSNRELLSIEKLYLSLKKTVQKTDIDYTGYIPRNEKISMESRHLGLRKVTETGISEKFTREIKLFKKITIINSFSLKMTADKVKNSS